MTHMSEQDGRDQDSRAGDDDPLVQERVKDAHEGANIVADAWRQSGMQVLRLDGFMGSGKTTLAGLIANIEGVRVISTDDFISEDRFRHSYMDGLRYDDLVTEVNAALQDGERIIVEGVCLERLLPYEDFGQGYRVYVKLVSGFWFAPIWHHFYELGREDAEDPIHADILRYHNEYRPHERNDLSIALPEFGS